MLHAMQVRGGAWGLTMEGPFANKPENVYTLSELGSPSWGEDQVNTWKGRRGQGNLTPVKETKSQIQLFCSKS